jgi:KDO2-lipid IV(A) lauroyltransferase
MPLPVAAVCGHLFGTCCWFLAGSVRRQTLGNLERAYGTAMSTAARRRTGRRSFALAGRGLFSWIVLHRMGPQRCFDRVEYVCDPAIRDEARRGAILVTQHFGLFEAANPRMYREFAHRPVGAVAEPGSATEMLVNMRRDMGGDTIEQGNARALIAHLKAGGVTAMLMDQDIRRVNGSFVPFFGHPAHTPVGPATFAVRLKIPLVLFRMEWTSLTRHRLTVGPLLRAREDLPFEDAVLELTARATEAGEACIRERPEHWLWMHERWRTRPADRPTAPHWPRPGYESLCTVAGAKAGMHTAT